MTGIPNAQSLFKLLLLVAPMLGIGVAEAALRCERNLVANVVALDQPLMFNRLGAQNVNGRESLAGQLASTEPAVKALLLDPHELGIPLDNVEGMTFGPDLAGGPGALVLVSDNNFAPAQFTQFLLFAFSEK